MGVSYAMSDKHGIWMWLNQVYRMDKERLIIWTSSRTHSMDVLVKLNGIGYTEIGTLVLEMHDGFIDIP